MYPTDRVDPVGYRTARSPAVLTCQTLQFFKGAEVVLLINTINLYAVNLPLPLSKSLYLGTQISFCVPLPLTGSHDPTLPIGSLTPRCIQPPMPPQAS